MTDDCHEYLKRLIQEALSNERTMIGQSVLRQLLEQLE